MLQSNHRKIENESFDFLMSIIFFCSIFSLWFQFQGLYGYNGILPIRDNISNIAASSSFYDFPSLLTSMPPLFGVSVEGLAEFLLLSGLIISFLLCFLFSKNVILISSFWVIYLSFFLVGSTFTSFQWDILLLEVAFLCILATINNSGTVCTNWCFRFLIFKLMLSSGLVKLQSQVQTMYIPTPRRY